MYFMLLHRAHILTYSYLLSPHIPAISESEIIKHMLWRCVHARKDWSTLKEVRTKVASKNGHKFSICRFGVGHNTDSCSIKKRKQYGFVMKRLAERASGIRRNKCKHSLATADTCLQIISSILDGGEKSYRLQFARLQNCR